MEITCPRSVWPQTELEIGGPTPQDQGEWFLEHMPGSQLVANGLTKLLLGQAFSSFLVELGMCKEGQGAKKSHWADKKRCKIARENEPATVGGPDGEKARSGNLRRLARENEPATDKRSRENEPEPRQDDGRV